MAFSYCHRNPVKIPKLDEILEQAKTHLMYERQFTDNAPPSWQLARVMYMLGESRGEVEKELNSAIERDDEEFEALQFGALYYEQKSQPDKALKCCEKALEIEDDDWFYCSIVRHCKRRLLSR